MNSATTPEPKLSAAQRKRLDGFNRTREQLLDQGYLGKSLTVSAKQMNKMAVVIGLPFGLMMYWVYSAAFRSSLTASLALLLILIAGTVLHELIHGLVWVIFCRQGWKSVAFGIDRATGSPYCYCSEGLSYWQYVLGSIMPTLILGPACFLLGWAAGSPLLIVSAIFQVFGGGGDMYLLWLIRNEKRAILLDHPYLMGCVAFEKPAD